MGRIKIEYEVKKMKTRVRNPRRKFFWITTNIKKVKIGYIIDDKN